MKANKILVISTIIILILLIASFIGFKKYQRKASLPPAVAINTAGQPMLGDPNAPVKIVVFEDLKCVNCKRFNDQFFTTIKQKYIDTKKANYTLVLLAFVPGSIPAGNAAFCLKEQNPDYFFPFVEYIFAHQPPEETDWATSPTLLSFAKKAVPGANIDALDQCIFTSKYGNTLQKNLEMAASIMKGTVATPSIFINGRPLDAMTIERINDYIDAGQ